MRQALRTATNELMLNYSATRSIIAQLVRRVGQLYNTLKASMELRMIRVLFVCLGNICRSPMAEAVMQHLVQQAGLEKQIVVDSVGTGDWHVGSPAHHGTRDVLQRMGIPYDGRARQLIKDDLQSATYAIAMDRENVAAIRALDRKGEFASKVRLLLDFAPEGSPRDVPDPYYEGNFDYVYELVDGGCRGLLTYIRAEHGL